MKKRFDGYLPVVIDVETAGLEDRRDALLEVAAQLIVLNDEGLFIPEAIFKSHVEPFEGAHINPEALKINGIDPFHPFRFAEPELDVIKGLFAFVREALKVHECRRAILVGHNAHFDLGFIKAAAKRCNIKDTPFHAFTVFDTATLGGLAYGKTVLAKACKKAGITFNKDEAHSAVYDTNVTARLFCNILNAQPFAW